MDNEREEKTQNVTIAIISRQKVARSCFFDHDRQEVGAPSSFAWDQKGYHANKTDYLDGGLCISVYGATSPLFRSRNFLSKGRITY